MTDAIRAEGLGKTFGETTALAGVDLAVRSGTVLGLLGPNGAGKTTLIRLLLGLIPATSGSISLLGCPIPADRDVALARVGAIVEEPRFHGFLTGRQNLEAIAAARGRGSAARIDASVERVGLAGRKHDRVAKYSLGMRQRLGVAACLLGDPALLVLDEPMNGLDPAGMLEFREIIRGLVDEGRTVVLSSHMLDEVERTCDSVAIVDQGKIVVQGSIAQLTAAGAGQVIIGVDRPASARQLLRDNPDIGVVDDTADGLVLTVRPTRPTTDIAADINRILVEAGFAVHRLESDRASLESRFLEVTSRLGDVA